MPPDHSTDMRFDFHLFDEEKTRDDATHAYLRLLERLAEIDGQYLNAHPETPEAYKSGVVVRQYFASLDHAFEDIGQMITRGCGAVDCIACWRVAELRRRGIAARPYLTVRKRRMDGGITLIPGVYLPDGTIEKPMELCTRDDASGHPIDEPQPAPGG